MEEPAHAKRFLEALGVSEQALSAEILSLEILSLPCFQGRKNRGVELVLIGFASGCLHQITQVSLLLCQLRNLMVSRMCLYLMILSELHLPWFVEQPSLSLMETHPMFVYFVPSIYSLQGAWTAV